MVLKRLPRSLLALAGLWSVAAFGAVPRDGLHPLALMASLLPLQLAALVWVWAAGPRAEPPPGPGWRPPASD